MSGAILAICVAGLVAAYMVQPRYQRVWLTAARFFLHLERRTGQERLGWGRPRPNRAFVLQLLVLLCLLVATLCTECRRTHQPEAIGLWVVLDTSASMTVQQGGSTRWAGAVEAVRKLGRQAQAAAAGAPLHLRLSTWDLVLEHRVATTPSVAELTSRASQLRPRALGTDVNVLRQELGRPQLLPGEWGVTHVAVVTDVPAPEWIGSVTNRRVWWFDLSRAVPNHGFTALQARRNPFSGAVERVEVEVRAYGIPVADARVVVISPGGEQVLQERLRWRDDGLWVGSFVPHEPGIYRLRLTPADAYPPDNHAAVKIEEPRPVRVDWVHGDREWAGWLGWQVTDQRPELRVLPTSAWSGAGTTGPIPTLWLEDRHPRAAGGGCELAYFDTSCPLLADVNLDALEQTSWPGRPRAELPRSFQTALMDQAGLVLVAYSPAQRAVYLADLPEAGTMRSDQAPAVLAVQTLYFNCLRWLLRERSWAPLYGLTDVGHPEPDDLHLALHPGEGNTDHLGGAPGSLDFRERLPAPEEAPLWQVPVLVALALLTLERSLAAWGGRAWQ